MSCKNSGIRGWGDTAAAGTLAPGAPADFAVLDLEFPWLLDAETLHSKSKNTAFDEARFSGRVMQTVVAGNPVYGA